MTHFSDVRTIAGPSNSALIERFRSRGYDILEDVIDPALLQAALRSLEQVRDSDEGWCGWEVLMRDQAHSSVDLRQIYQARFAGKSAYRQKVWGVLCSFFSRWIPPQATVLDLGCGWCEFINSVSCHRKFAMDLNPDAQCLANPGISVLQQDCSEAWQLAERSLDAVFTSNFFEHLPTKSALEKTLLEAHRTRERRTLGQWALLGLCGGLMLDVYYPNVVLLLIPLMESIVGYWRAWRSPGRDWAVVRELFSANVLFALLVVLAFTPTMVARQIISGKPLAFGYTALHQWAWTSPALGNVLFSSNHGLLSWTPIVLLALLGLLPLRKLDKELAAYLAVACLAFYYLIASHLFWHGMSSFGNRFFISLTPVFILGLTASFASLARRFERAGPAFAAGGFATAILVLWNAGLIFQWGMHMIPVRGPISWREVAYNQVFVVPQRAFHTMKEYLLARQALMGNIEQKDIRQLKGPPAPETDSKK